MKTLHLTNAYHATSGGVSTFYRALLKHANEHRRPMRLIVPAESSFTERVGENGIIYHVRAEPSPIADQRYRLLYLWGDSGREVRDILRHERPDLVETSDKYTLPLFSAFLRKGWIPGVPRPVLVATSHERMDDTAKAYFAMPPVWDVLSGLFMKQYYFPMFDWHIANSAYTAEELSPASKGHRLNREIRILPMGVDADTLRPDSRSASARCELAQMAGAPCESNLLLYVGRLATEKNLPLLVDMLERLSAQFSLVVAGDGLLSEWLAEQSVSRLQGRLRLIGHVARDRIARLYAGADAFVHANPKEPFGIAPLEAMAAGVPLIVPNSGGVLSYANDANSWLAEPDPDSFAKAVESVFADAGACREKISRARQTAVEHNWPRVVARYFDLYDEIISRGDVWSSKAA